MSDPSTPGRPSETPSGRPSDSQTDAPGPVADEPDPHRWWALAVIATAQLMVVLDATIVNIALPSAQRDLHISTGNRQWVITAYTLAFGGLLLLGGRIADLVGRKRTFVIGLIGFAGASAIGGASTGQEMLFLSARSRASSPPPGTVRALPAHHDFPSGKERAQAFGIFSAIAGAGSAIGLLLGGILTEWLSWRWCLYVNSPSPSSRSSARSCCSRTARAPRTRIWTSPASSSAAVASSRSCTGSARPSRAAGPPRRS